jgi:hypothetical protein
MIKVMLCSTQEFIPQWLVPAHERVIERAASDASAPSDLFAFPDAQLNHPQVGQFLNER